MVVVVVVVVGTVSSWPCITQIYQRPSLGGKMRIEGRTLFDSFAEETQIHVFEAREQRLQKLLSSAGYGGAVLCQEGLWDALGGARLVLSGKLQTRPRAWNIVERCKQFLHCNVQVFDGWQDFLTCRHDLVLSNVLLQCLGKPRSAHPSEIVTENTKISLLFQNILNMLALDCLCFV